MFKRLKRAGAIAVAVGAVLAGGVVQAAPVEAIVVTDVTGTISNQIPSMTLIQLGLLSAAAVLVGYRLIKRALG